MGYHLFGTADGIRTHDLQSRRMQSIKLTTVENKEKTNISNYNFVHSLSILCALHYGVETRKLALTIKNQNCFLPSCVL